ncbi:MAG: hypothetical protein ACF8QF_02185, partial [Phycisphaerales bacterium]
MTTGRGVRIATWIAIALVGGLLAFAGVMKIATGMPAQIAQGLAEFAIVGAMLWLRRWWLLWAGVACMFGAFAGWTGFLAWWGSSSCGCFGALSVAPEVTLVIDVAARALALATALLWTPKPAERAASLLTGAVLCAMLGAGVSSALANPLPTDFG